MRIHHRAYIPSMNGGGIHIHHIRHKNLLSLSKGKGIGDVLLNTGGTGGGSSYSSLDDYVSTTGVNPFAPSDNISGKGLGKFHKHLESLSIMPKKTKAKNINFSL
jgi:hypothetical protein